MYTISSRALSERLWGVDSSNQFARTAKNSKITGIAGDVIEQSVFRYARDSKQECDIEVDGQLTELKTTGVRVPKTDLKRAQGKIGDAYNVFLGAKECISITGVTFEPAPQTDFFTSHFWEKAEHLLIVFYEYKSYDVVPLQTMLIFPSWVIATTVSAPMSRRNFAAIGKSFATICSRSIPLPARSRNETPGLWDSPINCVLS